MLRYKKVGYLDIDVGQPEFTPPGFVSLHIFEEKPKGVVFRFFSLKNILVSILCSFCCD
jgi:polynucleotide 5'-hydroxyl-kinase GRC3/NOL9